MHTRHHHPAGGKTREGPLEEGVLSGFYSAKSPRSGNQEEERLPGLWGDPRSHERKVDSSDENTGLLVCLFIWILGGFHESKVFL